MSADALQNWAVQLASLPEPQQKLALAQEPDKVKRLLELIIEDSLLANTFETRPLLKIPLTVKNYLPTLSPPKLQQAYNLLDTPKLSPLSELIELDASDDLTIFLWGLQDIHDSTPRSELARLDPESRFIVSVVAVPKDDPTRKPPPDPFRDFIYLSDNDTEEYKSALKNLTASSLLFSRSELVPLAKLQLARLEDSEARSLKIVSDLAIDISLSESIRIEALITQGRLQFPQNPKAALTSWQKAKAWIAKQPKAYRLQLMLAHECAAAGLRDQAQELYLGLAQAPGNPFHLRVTEEIERIGF